MFAEPAEESAASAMGTILRIDPSLDALVPQTAAIEKLANGFQFIEGLLWRPKARFGAAT